MQQKREPTIRDVAKAAGVSRSTVSRILNDRSDVSAATRQKVQVVIKKLGFQPHAQARSLAFGRSRRLAVLHPLTTYDTGTRFRFVDFILMGFMSGIAHAAEEHNYFFNVLTQPFNEQELLGLYRSVQVDGAIIMQVGMQDWRAKLLAEHGLPFVMIGRDAANTLLDFVDLDFKAAALTAFQHLVEQGHRHIGFITYPAYLRQESYGPAIHSWRGYEQARATYNLTAHVREVDFDPAAITTATQELLQEEPRLTALINFNTSSIDRSLDVLHQMGYQVPENFSIIGFMIDQLAELMRPRLTTLDFPAHQMGYEAAQLLIKRLNNEPVTDSQILLTSDLLVRETTGPLRHTF